MKYYRYLEKISVIASHMVLEIELDHLVASHLTAVLDSNFYLNRFARLHCGGTQLTAKKKSNLKDSRLKLTRFNHLRKDQSIEKTCRRDRSQSSREEA